LLRDDAIATFALAAADPMRAALRVHSPRGAGAVRQAGEVVVAVALLLSLCLVSVQASLASDCKLLADLFGVENLANVTYCCRRQPYVGVQCSSNLNAIVSMLVHPRLVLANETGARHAPHETN
jgi:hypothetical protein